MYTPRSVRRRQSTTPRRTPTPAKRALDFGPSSVTKRVRYTPSLRPSAGTRRSIKTNYKLELGEPVGSSSCKSREAIDNFSDVTLYPSNTAISYGNCINVPQGTAINQRLGRQINLRGLTVEASFNFSFGDETYRGQIFHVHAALIAAKDITPTAAPALQNQDFFRNYGSNRGLDFSTAAATPMTLMSNPINTDKYEVLMHEKFQLTPFIWEEDQPWLKVQHQLRKYVPIERQVNFLTAEETSAEDTVFFVVWYTSLTSNPVTPITGLQIRMRILNHYRDPIN